MFAELQMVYIPTKTILRFNSEYLFTMPENMCPHAEILAPTHVDKVCIRISSNGEVRIASWLEESITLSQAFAYIFYPTKSIAISYSKIKVSESVTDSVVDIYNALGNNTIDFRYIMEAKDIPAPNDGVCITVKRSYQYGWQIYLINNINKNKGIYIRNWYQSDTCSEWYKIESVAISYSKKVIQSHGQVVASYKQYSKIASIILEAGKSYMVFGLTNITLGDGVDLISCVIDLESGDSSVLEGTTARSTGHMGGGAMSFMYISCETDCSVAISGYGYSTASYSYIGVIVAVEL